MKRSPIRRVSAKQAERNRNLIGTKARLIRKRGPACEAFRLYGFWLLLHPKDEDVVAASARCMRYHSDLHHKAGRGFRGCDEDSNLLLVCRNCHQLATNSDPVAYRVGLSVKHNGRVA